MSVQKQLTEHEIELARAQMNYWKKGRSIDEVFAFELGLNLICDNINGEYQDQALATVGLTRLPDVLLLVQVDDYQNKYGTMTANREYFVKATVWNCLHEQIRESAYDGFVANFLGLDALGCFLCLPQDGVNDSVDQELATFSDHLCSVVEKKTGIPITICVSERCHRLSDYTKAYTRARNMLYNSFYFGKRATVVHSTSMQGQEQQDHLSELTDCYPAVCATISGGNRQRFAHILQDICTSALEERIPPNQAKNKLVELIYTMGAYAQNCGLSHKEKVAPAITKYADLVLRSGYLEDILQYLLDYHSFLSQELEQLADRDMAQAFREPIQEYMKNHYGEEITLKDFAFMTGYSTYYFTRLFKKYFGCTMTNYLIEFRIEQSKELLISRTDSLGRIAEQCGFESTNYFSRCFRRKVGVTPTEYRNQQMEKQD